MTADHYHTGRIYHIGKEIVKPGKPPNRALWLHWCTTCNRIAIERPHPEGRKKHGGYQEVVLYEGEGQKDLKL